MKRDRCDEGFGYTKGSPVAGDEPLCVGGCRREEQGARWSLHEVKKEPEDVYKKYTKLVYREDAEEETGIKTSPCKRARC